MKKQYDISFDDPRVENGLEYVRDNLTEFLDECGIDYVLDGKNIGNDYYGYGPCLSCGDNRYHAAIHKDKLYLTCFICKEYTHPVKMVAHFKKMRISNALEYLINLSGDDEMDVEQRVKQIFRNKSKRDEYKYRGTDDLPENKKITRKTIERNPVLKAFLKERSIKPWDVDRYDLRIGIKEHKNKFIFPVYVGGNIVSYQWRLMTLKRYHIPPNLSKYLLWEDEIDSDKPCLLVEGLLDALHLKSFIDMYYPRKFSITTGFTKSISREQINILIDKNPKCLICVLDSGAWFEYNKYKNIFNFDVDFILLPKINGKESDPNSLSFKELRKVFIPYMRKNNYDYGEI